MSEEFKLQRSELFTLHESLMPRLAAEKEGLFDALSIGLDIDIAGNLPSSAPSPRTHLLKWLSAVNELRELTTRELPIAIVLQNAEFQLEKYPEGIRVKEISQQLRTRWLIGKLKSLIVRSELDDKQLSYFYKLSLPNDKQERYQYSSHKIEQAISLLFECRKSHLANYGIDICIFAYFVVNESIVLDEWDFVDWADRAKATMNWAFTRQDIENEATNKIAAARNSSKQEQIVVRVTSEDSNNLGIITVRFFKYSEEGKLQTIGDVIEAKLSNLPNIMQDMLIENAIDLAFIEVLLPNELMHANFEFLESKSDCLLTTNIVVRRFAERQLMWTVDSNKKAALQRKRHIDRWKRRWQTLSALENHAVKNFHRHITPDCLSDPENLKLDLNSQQDICCTVSEKNPKGKFLDLLRQHLVSGIPVMIWPGQSHTNSIKEEDATSLLNRSIKDLPSEMQKHQIALLRASDERFGENNLFIVFDDPDRMFKLDDEQNMAENNMQVENLPEAQTHE